MLEDDKGELDEFLEKEKANIFKWKAIPQRYKDGCSALVDVLLSILDPNVTHYKIKENPNLPFKSWILSMLSKRKKELIQRHN
jgi:hypothetical protein